MKTRQAGWGAMALLAVGAILPTSAHGQDTTPITPQPPNFSTLFPNPTNNNGYEEWVKAADLIRNNPKATALLAETDPTLAMRRRTLDDPDVAQALALIRAGLNKPVLSPHIDMDENTLLPELAYFRQLGRLIATEQYVAFADGRVDAAIRSLNTGLSFGYRMQTDSVISGLVGEAIDAIVLKEFNRHLDQLSVYQCDDVRRIAESFLGAESPALHLLALEKGYTLKILEARRSNADGLLKLLKMLGGDPDEEEPQDTALIRTHLTGHPEAVNAMIDDAEQRVVALFDQTLADMRLPASQRRKIALDQANSPGAALFRSITADPQQILKRYNDEHSKLRLLGVEALIRRYRWDHNMLPNDLKDLHAPNMIRDAFTGSEVVYKREGDRYTLTIRQTEGGGGDGR